MPSKKIELIEAIAIARGTEEPTNKDVFWLDKSYEGGFYDRLKSYNYDTEKWELVSRSTAELLTDLKTVDGAGSGLDSDTLRGYTPEELISSGGSGLPPLSTGKIIVGQGDTIGQAKTLGGIATIDANGSMSYVTNSISHTGLTDVGTNTHVQIDSHIADSAIHLSTAQATKIGHISVTQAVDLDQMETDITANNAKVTNATHTGDVTGATALTIADDAVTNAKSANMATQTIKGRNTAGTGNPEDLSATQVRGIINVEDGATADQTDAEIETAYNNQVAEVTQAEAESGTVTTVKRWTPERIKQAIDALSGGGSGGGIINVTTAQKLALTPSTGDFVYDSDLNALQRYNGSSWVSVAVGYGIISIKDSNGVPTFYNDLQTALNATNTIDTIFIHSDIELTSTVNLPITREKLTFVMNGYRIFGDTSTGDFNLFETAQNSSITRTVNFEGGGIVETVGTCVSVSAACPWNTTGSQKIDFMNLGSTTFKSENANCFRAQTSEIKGGILIAPNSTFFGTNNFIGTNFEIYESCPTNLAKVVFCNIFISFGSWFVNNNNIFSNNVIKGTTSKSGNNGLIYGYAGAYISNNYIELQSGATKDALYIRGSGTDNHGIKNNVVYNFGSGSSGNLVFGSSYDNYFYSENAWGSRVGANCKNFIRNTVITNSTIRPALDSLCDYTFDNTAICLNSSHTNNPLYVGGTTNEVFNNKAVCSNASISNIKLYSTGTVYLANNIMSTVGSGLDLNGNSNSMTNTPDTFGNLQIG